VDSSGNVYASALNTHNAFKIATPGTCSTGGTPCTITEIIDATGDGAGNTPEFPEGVAVDSSGNVFVTGFWSDNVFKIATPGTCSTGGTPCTITEIIDSAGDGAGNSLGRPVEVAANSKGSVYVTGSLSNNALKIATPGACSTGGTPCTITEIIDSTGDGAGNSLSTAYGVTADSRGAVYVAGYGSQSAFKIAAPRTCSTSGTPCTITEIVDYRGDGAENTLGYPTRLAVDSGHNVYVIGEASHNAFKIQPPPVPVLSNHGLMFLGVSLVCAALWVARRQRLANA
jgi:hypothetical protein